MEDSFGSLRVGGVFTELDSAVEARASIARLINDLEQHSKTTRVPGTYEHLDQQTIDNRLRLVREAQLRLEDACLWVLKAFHA